MKLRWRQHEILFVAVLVVSRLIAEAGKRYMPDFFSADTNYAIAFRENGFPFNYDQHVLLPKAGSVLLLFLAYLFANLLIIPAIKKISFRDFEKIFSVNILRPLLMLLTGGFFLALGMNALTALAKPWLVSYSGYNLLAIFGYNDQPLTNVFFGFGRAVSVLLVMILIGELRELIIWFIQKNNDRRDFRFLIANNITALIFLYFLILIIMNPVHYTFVLYVVCVTPAIILYIYLTFFLFPYKGAKSFLSKPMIIRLMVATALCSLPYIFFTHAGNLFQFLLYWIFLLLIVTPVCWLLYQQRADEILQLRGMETQLATSDASLQMLRSQINPHFLFNALNTLYGTALSGNLTNTAEGIQKLGDMMRFMLHENVQDFIPLSREAEYLRNYISLQKLRIPSDSGITINEYISEGCDGLSIAPMLLIPFVENAFKHGISLNEKSWIDIRLECSESEIRLDVKNSRHIKNKKDPGETNSGIGLKNVTERLKLLYPGKHDLRINSNDGEFVASLSIYPKTDKRI